MQDAAFWQHRFQMQAHPEGGFWAPAYRSDESLTVGQSPPRYRASRNLWSSIYFLVTAEAFSAFHRLLSDELWHFYAGDPLRLHCVSEEGHYEPLTLGLEAQMSPQILVQRNTWFAAAVPPPGSYTLCGCTLSPGFDFADFQLGERAQLKRAFPRHQALWERFTRQ